MNLIVLYLPFLVSLVLGYLLTESFFQNKKRPETFVHLFLAAGLGLGVSAAITFLSFLVLNQYSKIFCILAHLFLLGLLLFPKLLSARTSSGFLSPNLPQPGQALCFLVLFLFSFPLWIQAKFYPFGGWDAWQVWNFKAKFLFLSGNQWQNVLDPILWRSSPHYPLLLPLVNVWGWTLGQDATAITPLVVSVLWTFLTLGLLLALLLQATRNYFSLLAPFLLLTIPFYGTLATSQYCDMVVGYFLLASLYCLMESLTEKGSGFALLSGAFAGLLSFTKPEGTVAALFIALMGFFILLLKHKGFSEGFKKSPWFLFLAGLTIFSLPSIIFQIFYSPGNQTFVNGLSQGTNPATTQRLKMIFAFFAVELQSQKWGWVWPLLGIGVVLSKGKGFWGKAATFPLFLLGYLTIILSYYYINTYFKIEWWLQVSLNRILFSLLPTCVFWVFYSLFPKKGDT